MLAAHAVRDGGFDSPSAAVIDTAEVFDIVVVEGGISGLAAAFYFKDQAKPKPTCLALENHPIFGGQARRNEFVVDGQRLMVPQGSNWFQMPPPSPLIDPFSARIGVNWREFKYQEWVAPSPPMELSRNSYHHARTLPPPPNFGFWFGAKCGQQPEKWVVDPWRNIDRLPLSPALRSDFAKYLKFSPAGRPKWKFQTISFSRPIKMGTALSPSLRKFSNPRARFCRFKRVRRSLSHDPAKAACRCPSSSMLSGMRRGSPQAHTGGRSRAHLRFNSLDLPGRLQPWDSGMG
jgi:spermidine dehydrogenase